MQPLWTPNPLELQCRGSDRITPSVKVMHRTLEESTFITR